MWASLTWLQSAGRYPVAKEEPLSLSLSLSLSFFWKQIKHCTKHGKQNAHVFNVGSDVYLSQLQVHSLERVDWQIENDGDEFLGMSRTYRPLSFFPSPWYTIAKRTSITKSARLHTHTHTHTHTRLPHQRVNVKVAPHYSVSQHIRWTIPLISSHEIWQPCIKTALFTLNIHNRVK